MLKEITKNAKEPVVVQKNVWMVFHKLLESCEKTDYNFLLNDMARLTDENIQAIKDDCSKEVEAITALKDEFGKNLRKLQKDYDDADKEKKDQYQQIK